MYLWLAATQVTNESNIILNAARFLTLAFVLLRAQVVRDIVWFCVGSKNILCNMFKRVKTSLLNTSEVDNFLSISRLDAFDGGCCDLGG